MARDWRSFSVLLPDLATHFHIFALDLRGHGGSGRVSRGYGMSEFADDVDEFIRAIAPEAAIFGHSLGAMVGMCVAARAHSRIRSLIVGDSMISTANLAASLYGPLFREMHKLMTQRHSRQELARAIGEIRVILPYFDEPLRLGELTGSSEAAMLEWARTLEQTDPDVLAMSLDGSAFTGWNPERILPNISCPVLLLQANPELDGLLLDSNVDLALRLLPRGEHVRFPLLGHALFIQQAKPVLNVVMEFLSRSSG
jgi:pimeloyl-ACP methyl ester carboxylesterase